MTKIWLICICCILPSVAQDKPNLMEKYESLSITEIYKIRQGITATVKYSAKRKIQEIIIEDLSSVLNCGNTDNLNTIDDGLIREILLPLKLGKTDLSFQIATSANNMTSMEIYSNLTVMKWFAFAKCRKDFLTYRRVAIKFDDVVVKSIIPVVN